MGIKLFTKAKDGGPNSPVDAYFLIEWKGLFSVALLKFNKGKREEYHTHAFDALTWFLKGDLVEERLIGIGVLVKQYKRSFIPKVTTKANLHRVKANEDSWCLTLRGPWSKYWTEYDEVSKVATLLSTGRKIEHTGLGNLAKDALLADKDL